MLVTLLGGSKKKKGKGPGMFHVTQVIRNVEIKYS